MGTYKCFQPRNEKFLFNFKEGDPPTNFGGLTAGIHEVFRGLKFESDTENGQKKPFMVWKLIRKDFAHDPAEISVQVFHP